MAGRAGGRTRVDAGEGRAEVRRVPPIQGRGGTGDCCSTSRPEGKHPAEESRLRFTFNQHEMINKEVLREMVLTYYKRHREEAKLFHSLVYTTLYYLAVVCIFITRIQHPAEERASDSEILIRVG